MQRLALMVWSALVAPSLAGCEIGEVASGELVVAVADPARGLELRYLDDGHALVMTTALATADGHLAVTPRFRADGRALAAAELAAMAPGDRDGWVARLDGAAAALELAELPASLDRDRATLGAGLRQLVQTVRPPTIEQDITWVTRQAGRSFALGGASHREPDQLCPSFGLLQTVQLEWTSDEGAYVSWHGSSYFVDLGHIVNGGALYGYTDENFLADTSDVWNVYYNQDWGTTHWTAVDAEIHAMAYPQAAIFEKYTWNFGGALVDYACDDFDRLIVTM